MKDKDIWRQTEQGGPRHWILCATAQASWIMIQCISKSLHAAELKKEYSSVEPHNALFSTFSQPYEASHFSCKTHPNIDNSLVISFLSFNCCFLSSYSLHF